MCPELTAGTVSVTRTLTNRKTREKGGRDKKTILFLGSLVIASEVRLLSFSFAPKQVNWIHNGL